MVGAHKVVYLLGHPAALSLGGHLVHPIQQHDAVAIFQLFLEEAFGALFGQIGRGAQDRQVTGRQGQPGAR